MNKILALLMNRSVALVLVALAVLLPADGFAIRTMQDTVADILRMRQSPEVVADSAFAYIYLYDVNHRGEAYALCENAFARQLIPYAERNSIDKSKLSRYYDELGQMQLRQGKERAADARKSYAKAIKYANESGNYYRKGRVLDHQMIMEGKYGDVAKSFDLARKAIAAYRKSGEDADRYITRCYYAMAIAYLQLDDTDGLGKVIDEMKAITKEIRPENRNFHLYNQYSIEEAYYGTLYEKVPARERKRYAELCNQASLNTIRLLESFDEEERRKTSVNPVWNYYNRAVFFVNFNDRPPMDSVQYYLDKAIAIDHDNKADDINEIRISAAEVLAEAWMKNGNYPKAKEILLETMDRLPAAEGINAIIIDKIDLYKTLREIARQSGNYEDALVYSDSINSCERRRYSIQQAKALKDLEIKYKTQETELALSRSEASRSATLMWLFAVAGVLFLVGIIFIVYANRQRRRRMQREIEFANLRADIGQQLTEQYIEGLENERQRMSRELHDGVCNDLLAIEMNISGGKPIDSTVSLIGSCREAVRRISHELMPPEFAYANLDEVVRYYIGKQAQANADKIQITYESSAGDAEWADIPDQMSLEVYRIIQEAVGNAVKHSGSTQISVSLTLDGKVLTATVTDNGTYKESRAKGIGLVSIRKRANYIKGDVSLDHHADGTTLRLIVKVYR